MKCRDNNNIEWCVIILIMILIYEYDMILLLLYDNMIMIIL